jgi:hypothetical protein
VCTFNCIASLGGINNKPRKNVQNLMQFGLEGLIHFAKRREVWLQMYTRMAKDWQVSVGQGWSKARRAMKYGRKVDREIQLFSTKDMAYDNLGEGARAVIAKIREKEWKIIKCQYQVSDAARLKKAAKPIVTYIDILCKDKEGVYVILELKSTETPYGRYKEWFHVPDPKHPKMVDGLPNTAYWRQQKQLWGNMHLWTIQEGTEKKIKGFVVLACRGVALLLPLDKRVVKKNSE